MSSDSNLQSLEETGDKKEETLTEGRFIFTGAICLIAIGGWCYYRRKMNSSENEGGHKEDKMLFKKVFKGKT